VDLRGLANITRADAQDIAKLALEEIGPTGDSDEDKNNLAVLEQIFGISQACGKPFLLVPFRWFCANFGRRIIEPHHIHGVWKLELDTRLAEYRPPFGFPAPDENVAHLTREEIRAERTRLAECVQKAADEWLAKQRESFLFWLDICIREDKYLIVIET